MTDSDVESEGVFRLDRSGRLRPEGGALTSWPAILIAGAVLGLVAAAAFSGLSGLAAAWGLG